MAYRGPMELVAARQQPATTCHIDHLEQTIQDIARVPAALRVIKYDHSPHEAIETIKTTAGKLGFNAIGGSLFEHESVYTTDGPSEGILSEHGLMPIHRDQAAYRFRTRYINFLHCLEGEMDLCVLRPRNFPQIYHRSRFAFSGMLTRQLFDRQLIDSNNFHPDITTVSMAKDDIVLFDTSVHHAAKTTTAPRSAQAYTFTRRQILPQLYR